MTARRVFVAWLGHLALASRSVLAGRVSTDHLPVHDRRTGSHDCPASRWPRIAVHARVTSLADVTHDTRAMVRRSGDVTFRRPTRSKQGGQLTQAGQRRTVAFGPLGSGERVVRHDH